MSKTIEIDLNKLLAAGVHFGHYKKRWHPKIAPYLHSVRQGRCVVDLTLTKAALERALPAIADLVAQNKPILFVGTKIQAREIVQKAAESVHMPYVNYRWVGGMLTNYPTISIQIKKLKDLERRLASGELANKYSKLEIQNYQKEIDGLNLLYGGIKEMGIRPGIVFVTDMQTNAIAVTETNKLGIPLVAIADTNVDPTLATYPIPGNDDALKSLQIITALIVEAVKSGLTRAEKPEGLPPPSTAPVRRTANNNAQAPAAKKVEK